MYSTCKRDQRKKGDMESVIRQRRLQMKTSLKAGIDGIMIVILWIGCCLDLGACAMMSQSALPLWEIRITEQELQQQVASAFPQEKRVILHDQTILVLTVSHPQIALPDGGDRIHMRIDTGWHFPDIRLGARWPVLRPGFTTGYLMMSGRLKYVPEAGDFYLQDLEIHDSHLPGLPAKYEPEARNMLQIVAAAYVGNMPIYSLKEKGFTAELGRRVLRSVDIKNRELVVVLGFLSQASIVNRQSSI